MRKTEDVFKIAESISKKIILKKCELFRYRFSWRDYK